MKQFVCSLCRQVFGSELPPNDDYEKDHEGMILIQRFTDTLSFRGSYILCPECGKKYWDEIEELAEKKLDEMMKKVRE